MTISELTKKLYEVEQKEKEIKAERVRLEAELAEALGAPDDWEGTRSSVIDSFKVVAKRSMNIKIDANMLGEITRRHGLEAVTGDVFRFKPELNKKAFGALPQPVKNLYAPAITKTPGKMSFSVELKEDK